MNYFTLLHLFKSENINMQNIIKLNVTSFFYTK